MALKKTLLIILLAFYSYGFAEAVTLTFKPVQKNDDRQVIDLGVPGPSLGDSILGHGIINDLHGKEIGYFEFISFVTDKRTDSEIRWLNAQYAFGPDSILIEGAQTFMANNGKAPLNVPSGYAVTGGTGKYSGAKGECRVVRVADGDFNIICKFTALRNHGFTR